ncbi:LINE-1 type transposase domain containing protein 1 [Dissostichus eleginoides]|uniref:LINE-1 type transposase domain containing protein 1 n=1 Tax=Dissostichus eleginoides TaxID=100907 RepID=A0AAD9C9S0_DISEL|nr:LINE-1 type transposase domain containing protein 1 [Dissostichus eleginoides]
MPKSQRSKPGPNATDSPEKVTAESTEPLSDTQTIMAALKRTEQCVLNKIDSTVTAAVGELHTKIDNLSRDLRSEISNVRTEFTKVVEDVKKENATFVMRIGDLEEGANGYANRVVELEAKVTTLSSQVNRLVDKTEDLESRQRRDNCRLVGVAEGVGNIRPEKAIAQLLQDALSLDYTPTLDRAHRGLQPKPAGGDAPRPIIIKFHYFQEKADIIRKAMGAGPIFHNVKRFYIYPDSTLSIVKMSEYGSPEWPFLKLFITSPLNLLEVV